MQGAQCQEGPAQERVHGPSGLAADAEQAVEARAHAGEPHRRRARHRRREAEAQGDAREALLDAACARMRGRAAFERHPTAPKGRRSGVVACADRSRALLLAPRTHTAKPHNYREHCDPARACNHACNHAWCPRVLRAFVSRGRSPPATQAVRRCTSDQQHRSVTIRRQTRILSPRGLTCTASLPPPPIHHPSNESTNRMSACRPTQQTTQEKHS